MRSNKTGLGDSLPYVGLVLIYMALYAPYGINETDGGFISGLAWQLLQGKVLYADVVYVRPPLPVWLRAVEMMLLPDTGAVLAERCLFYAKTGLYAWLAAAMLAHRPARAPLAMAGFMVSVHHYPAAAWHTVDGILLAVTGFYFLLKRQTFGSHAVGGLLVAAAMLCKQSFYPLAGVLLLLVWLQRMESNPWPALLGWAGGLLVFGVYLYTAGLLSNYLVLTGGSAGFRDAVEHGLLDYGRIDAKWLAFTGLIGLLGVGRQVVGWKIWPQPGRPILAILFVGWLVGLAALYVAAIYKNQAFTLPFGPVRLCFLVSVAFLLWEIRRWRNHIPLWVLSAIAWCSALSWGYNLPILLATPWIYVCGVLAAPLWREHSPALRVAVPGLLFGLFFYAHQFVYRDGKRAEMRAHLGDIFPALYGIYSTEDKAAMYADLKNIVARYSGPFKTIPAFPQANFITKTSPPLPLDWLVQREIGGADSMVRRAIQTTDVYYLILRSDLAVLQDDRDPQLAFARRIWKRGRVVEETRYFILLTN